MNKIKQLALSEEIDRRREGIGQGVGDVGQKPKRVGGDGVGRMIRVVYSENPCIVIRVGKRRR